VRLSDEPMPVAAVPSVAGAVGGAPPAAGGAAPSASSSAAFVVPPASDPVTIAAARRWSRTRLSASRVVLTIRDEAAGEETDAKRLD
jgi:hypothetical protein